MEEKQAKKVISSKATPSSQDRTETSTIRNPNHGKSMFPPGGSPGESSVSSGHSSPLTHGFSPNKEEDKFSTPPRGNSPAKSLSSPVPVINRFVRDEPVPETLTNSDPVLTGARSDTGTVVEEGGGGTGRKVRPPLSSVKKAQREAIVNKSALAFRILGSIFCLISFSVMATDRNQGWALDSFDRYKEFRYCLTVNIIGFVYSGAQASAVAYRLASANIARNHLFLYFDFAFDQMVTYLLISASSSAATRVDDWQLNWGKDKFPFMAGVSVSVSFLAFVAFAITSLISGFALFTYDDSFV